MDKTLMLSLILLLCITTVPAVYSQYYSKTLPCPLEEKKVTNLRFFFHGTIGGENPTAVTVARANITTNDGNYSLSNSIVVEDVFLTIGPDPISEVIGNAQGLEVFAGRDTTTVVVYLDFGFTKGKFKGSSISVFSRNPAIQRERELAVVGGRGKFRMAQGFALLKTYFVNQTTVIVDYNVTVFHY